MSAFPFPEARLALQAPFVTRRHYSPGTHTPWQQSSRATLLYPSAGTMTLHTRTGCWVVSSTGSCWLPGGEEYRIETTEALDMLEVCCPGLPRLLPERSGIVPISNLLRELVLALEKTGDMGALCPMELILGTLSRQFVLQDVAPLKAPLLSCPRLQAIRQALSADPCDPRTLEDWARQLGTTSRTLARSFREAGVTFRELRRLARVQAAMRLLESGQPVTSVAYDVGFHSPASFIASFRKATGTTPGQYCESRKSSASARR